MAVRQSNFWESKTPSRPVRLAYSTPPTPRACWAAAGSPARSRCAPWPEVGLVCSRASLRGYFFLALRFTAFLAAFFEGFLAAAFFAAFFVTFFFAGAFALTGLGRL